MSAGIVPWWQIIIPTAWVRIKTGNISYVAEEGFNEVWKITPAGVVSHLASLSGVCDVAPDDNGNVYAGVFNSGQIYKINSAGTVSALAVAGAKCYGIAFDRLNGVLYTSDYNNNRIWKVTTNGTASIFAGSTTAGTNNGSGSSAGFYHPWGLDTDQYGNVFVADYGNSTIRKITSAGLVTTVAGTPGVQGLVNGPAVSAKFLAPAGIAVDTNTGNLYVADTFNNCIRLITSDGAVSTIAGNGPGSPGLVDGTGSTARLDQPFDLNVAAGTLYVADTYNGAIRKLSSPLANLAQANISGSGGVAVSLGISNLTPATTYFYRVQATNWAGLSLGGVSNFTTVSTNALLSGLSFSCGSFTPAFASNVYFYSNSTLATSVSFTATTASSNASLQINSLSATSGQASSPFSLVVGSNTFVISVTAQDGTVQSYTNLIVCYKIPASVVLANLSATFDGAAKSASASTTPSGLAVQLTYQGSAYSLTTNAPTNAGSYTVVGSITDANYIGSATNTLTISPASQTISFPAIAKQRATNLLTLPASASSGLAIAYSVISGSAVVTNGNQLVFTGLGLVSVQADQAGNSNYNAAASASQSFYVVPAAPSVALIHNATTNFFLEIQPAVNASVSGDTVLLGAGTYIEQVAITNAITLSGVDASSSIIQSPSTLQLGISGGNWTNLKAQAVYAIVAIKTQRAAAWAVVKNLTVDGNDQGYLPDTSAYPDKNSYTFDGISAFNSDVLIDSVNVTRVREISSDGGGSYVIPSGYASPQPSGYNHNNSIFAESALGAAAHTITVSNSVISKFQKTGILVWGPTLTVNISSNVIQGYGMTVWSTGNGIQIASTDLSSQGGAHGNRTGTQGVIANNQVLGIGIVVPAPGQISSYTNIGLGGSTAIMAWHAGPGLQISGNTITGCTNASWYNAILDPDGNGWANVGISTYLSDNPQIQYNAVSGFDSGIEDMGSSTGSALTVISNAFAANGFDLIGFSGDDKFSLVGPTTLGYLPQANGVDAITNFTTGDWIFVSSATPLTGSVSRGYGTNVAASSVQVEMIGGITRLFINTNTIVSAADLEIDLSGSYAPGNFILSNSYIGLVSNPDFVAPSVSSITRYSPTATVVSATQVTFRAQFSEAVTNVTTNAFTLALGGTATGTIASLVTNSASSYDVTVTGVSGVGAVELDVKSSGTGITDLVGNDISGGYTTGQTYYTAILADLTTQSASSILSASATLNGAFCANDSPAGYYFQYSTDPTLSTRLATPTNAGYAGTATNSVSQIITGLLPAVTYYYRIAATNLVGSTNGAISNFTTLSTNALLAGLTPSTGSLAPAFASSALFYTNVVDHWSNTITFTPAAADAYITSLTVNGTTQASGAVSAPITLLVGTNIVKIVVTAQDGLTQGTTTVSVVRQAILPEVATLAASSVWTTNATLNGRFCANDTPAGAYFQYSTSPVFLTSLATVTNSGFAGLSTNSAIQIVSNLAPGVTYYYRLCATNMAGVTNGPTSNFTTISTNALLAGLTPSTGSLAPAFASNTLFYTNVVDHWSNTITFTPAAADAYITSLTVNGTTQASGAVSAPITLVVGTNIVKIVVTAQDGLTQGTTTVSVVRQAILPEVATLAASSVWTTNATLNGRFCANDTPAGAYFQYSTSPVFLTSLATVTNSGFAGLSTNSAIQIVSNLAPGVTYYYRLCATNMAGVTNGPTSNFTTISTNALLAGLTPSTGSLAPAFASSALFYTNVVDHWSNSITFTPAAADAYITSLTVNGTTQASGAVSAPITLLVGTNIVKIVITAQDGLTQGTTTVSVVRQAILPEVATLAASSVWTTNATLNGRFCANDTPAGAYFQYSTSPVFLTSLATVTNSGFAGLSTNSAIQIVSNLAPGVTYYYRLCATNMAGVTNGPTSNFTTISTNALLAGLTPSTGSLAPAFASSALFYTNVVDHWSNTITFTPAAADAYITSLTVNGTTQASGAVSAPITLLVGTNIVKIVVTAQDGLTQGTTTVSVVRQAILPEVATLAASSVWTTNATLNGRFCANDTPAGAYFQYSTSPVFLTSLATATNFGFAGLSTNSAIQIVSNLAPGVTYYYRLCATNMAGVTNGPTSNFTTISTNALLANLTLSSGSLSPLFAPPIANYSNPVAYAASSITVTPTVDDSRATVTVNGTTVSSGYASTPISLAVGTNTLAIVVSAQDGLTKCTVTVQVVRAAILPSVTTQPASNVWTANATLNGSFCANATPAGAYFQYSTTPAFTTFQTTATNVGFAGLSINAISQTISNLIPEQTYYYRLCATNIAGVTNGPAASFTTISTNAQLSNLALSSGDLTPSFTSNTYAYSSTMTATSIMLVTTAASSNATLKINGQTAQSGQASDAINLAVGTNTFIISVTAQNGAIQSYTLVIVRLKVTVAITLANLVQTYNAQPLAALATTAPADAPVTLTYNGLNAAPVNAGSYTVVATVSNAIYTGTATNTFTITKAALSVQANNQTRLYGDTNPVLALTYTGFAGNDTAATLAAQPVATCAATASSPAAAYPITVSDGASANYNITYANATLTVAKAPLSLSASNATRLYGQANPILTATISGIKNSDNLSATNATAATINSPVGAYDITPVLQDPTGAATNYTVSLTSAILAITPAPLTIKANDTFRFYGQINPAFTTVATGLQNSDTINITCATPAQTNSPAGTYPIIPSLATTTGVATNYAITWVNGTLTIGGTISLNTTPATYVLGEFGDEYVNIDPTGAVFDGGSLHYEGATMTITIAANATPGDQLEIIPNNANAITLNTTNIAYANVTFGDYTGGNTLTPLVVTLNANATSAQLTALIRTLTLTTTNQTYSTKTIRIDLDYGGQTISATRAINLDRPPTANNDAILATRTNFIIPSTLLLANDTDLDSDTLHVEAYSDTTTQGGHLANAATGLHYTPPDTTIGGDKFAYLATDNKGGWSIGWVSITFLEARRITMETDAKAQIHLYMGGEANATYKVEYTEDMQTWEQLGIVKANDFGAVESIDPLGKTRAHRYYRIRQQ